MVYSEGIFERVLRGVDCKILSYLGGGCESQITISQLFILYPLPSKLFINVNIFKFIYKYVYIVFRFSPAPCAEKL